MILLLAQNSIQERTLGITLKLGGHDAQVVNDELEVINMIKTVPKQVRGLVIGGGGCQRTLAARISLLSDNQIFTPIYLVGLSVLEKDLFKLKNDLEHQLTLSICNNEGLLQSLNRKARIHSDANLE